MQSLFCEGYGMQEGVITEFLDLNDRLYGWAIPFVHEDTGSTIANLVAAKNSGILSAETASAYTTYGTNHEYEIITREAKKAQEADRLYQLKNNKVAK